MRAIALAKSKMDACTQRLAIARHVQLFLEEFVPLCYVLGWMTRRCAWEGRARGTGVWARQMLELSLVVLHGIPGRDPSGSLYCRSISAALLSWSSWHDELPACAYVEEACEALLSKLGRPSGATPGRRPATRRRTSSSTCPHRSPRNVR